MNAQAKVIAHYLAEPERQVRKVQSLGFSIIGELVGACHGKFCCLDIRPICIFFGLGRQRSNTHYAAASWTLLVRQGRTLAWLIFSLTRNSVRVVGGCLVAGSC